MYPVLGKCIPTICTFSQSFDNEMTHGTIMRANHNKYPLSYESENCKCKKNEPHNKNPGYKHCVRAMHILLNIYSFGRLGLSSRDGRFSAPRDLLAARQPRRSANKKRPAQENDNNTSFQNQTNVHCRKPREQNLAKYYPPTAQIKRKYLKLSIYFLLY